MDSNSVKVIDELLFLKTFKHYLIIQAKQAQLQVVRCLPAGKVADHIQDMVVYKLSIL